MGDLPHLDDSGDARMVDVGDKEPTRRKAVAEAHVALSPTALAAFTDGTLPKGDAAAVARVAAVMAVKRTPELVPLCHPLSVSSVDVDVEPTDSGVRVQVTVTTTDRTGVEMEALTGAAVGALTVYDMTKALDRGAEIGPVRLLHKSGGKSGTWER